MSWKPTPNNETSRVHRGTARAVALHRSPPIQTPPLPRSWYLYFLVALGCLCSADSQGGSLLSTNVPSLLPPPLPDAGFSVIRVFGALTLVIALFLAGVWIFKNWHRVGVRGRPQNLQVLESRSLGGRHALYVVGYQGQRLLLSASPSGVSLLSHLPAAETEPVASPGPEKGGNQNFVHALQQALQQKA